MVALSLVGLLTAVAPQVSATTWHHYRGDVARSGRLEDVDWASEKPEVAWKFFTGGGSRNGTLLAFEDDLIVTQGNKIVRLDEHGDAKVVECLSRRHL